MNKCPALPTNATIRPNKPHWLKCPISPTALGLQGAEEDARHTCTLQVPELWRGDTGPRCRRSQRCEAAEGLWRAVASCGELWRACALARAKPLYGARVSKYICRRARWVQQVVSFQRWSICRVGRIFCIDGSKLGPGAWSCRKGVPLVVLPRRTCHLRLIPIPQLRPPIHLVPRVLFMDECEIRLLHLQQF